MTGHKMKIDHKFNRVCTKKTNGRAKRELMAEKTSMEKQTWGASPGVIAKLMGLDQLPSQGTLEPQEVKRCSKQDLLKELKENFTAREDCLLPISVDEHHEFKDVFEVMEAPKAERHKNYKEIQTHLKHSEMDVSVLRRRFIKAKHLSTDEKHKSNKDFNYALDVPDSNKDLFQKFPHEPSFLFSKHLNDLTHSGNPPFACHSSHSASTKSSSSARCEPSSRSQRYAGRCTHLRRADSESFMKIASTRNSHPFHEHSCYLPERLSHCNSETKSWEDS